MIRLYRSYVRPILEYGSMAFLAAPKMQLDRLQKIQNDAIRICLKLPKYIRIELLHEYASMMPVTNRLAIFNKKLINIMKTNNIHIESLVSNHTFSIATQKSPLDIILSY